MTQTDDDGDPSSGNTYFPAGDGSFLKYYMNMPVAGAVPRAPVAKTSKAAFKISARSNTFRERFFPGVPARLWNDWRWQIQNRFHDAESLSKIITLTDTEKEMLTACKESFPCAITPYYASLLDPEDISQPIRLSVVPRTSETLTGAGESDDPLNEDAQSPVPGIVHRYPDRVLFLVTDYCSTFCRYCTRSRMVGRGEAHFFNHKGWERAIEYIHAHTEVRDVLISGGDPLTLSDGLLEWLLEHVRAIPHV